MTAGEFFFKLSFKPPFRQIKHLMLDWAKKWRHRSWRRWHEHQGNCHVHPSLEIRDETPVTRDNIRLGRGTVFERDVTLWLSASDTSTIELGDQVYVGRNCYLGAMEPLRIGKNTLIGAYSYIITANHVFSNPAIPIREQGYASKPVTIGCDVWIGAHVVILPGVTIGDTAVIGAGAVVTKSIPAGEIWAGVPARRLGLRGESQNPPA